jgi:hypothetical protein
VDSKATEQMLKMSFEEREQIDIDYNSTASREDNRKRE